VRDLSRPEAYPSPPQEVEFLQTHISLLFFAGERVYKLKKAVDLGFLDYSSLDRRRTFCDEEVRLNRRLAPRVYVGVVAVTLDAQDRARIGGDGPAVEWAVEMVRLPEARMLTNLLERGEIDNRMVDDLVALLVAFHARAATGPGVDEHGAPEAVAANAEENFRQLERLVGADLFSRAHLDFLATAARRFLSSHADRFARRLPQGRIREGHGDLHAGNLCFTKEGVIAYDCIEFSRRLRCGDVANELAFLAMDLDDRGYPGFSSYLVKRYADATKDPDFDDLVDFYKGYRAVVRAKVAAMTSVDPLLGPGRQVELQHESMRYLQLAAGYSLPPAMVLLCGLPGTGKSWLAAGIARLLRAALHSSDAHRKALARIPATTRVRPGYGEGLYAPEAKARAYESLLETALADLRSSRSVVVDASFGTRAQRQPFLVHAERFGAPCFVLHVTAPEAVVRERMAARALDPRAVSDADFEVYRAARASFEPPGEVAAEYRIEVRSGEERLDRIGRKLVERRITDFDRRVPSGSR